MSLGNLQEARNESWGQRIIRNLESAWLTSAQATHCLDMEVKGDVEELPQNPVQERVQLLSGHSMPSIGLGTYQATGQQCYEAVLSALRLGFRHIDTASMYNNEAEIGRAVADSGLRREEVFITTKLWPPDAWGYEPAKAALRASLERLGTSYVDLALLHAPGPVESRGDTWRALEDCAAAGLVRSLGVSNFGVAQLQRLAAGARLAPAVNQLELHPWRRWPAEEAYCRKRGLALQAYSPLACGERLGGATLAEVATRVGRSPAQVLLRWSLQRGFVPLPKCASPEHQRQDLDVWGWELSAQDLAALDRLGGGCSAACPGR